MCYFVPVINDISCIFNCGHIVPWDHLNKNMPSYLYRDSFYGLFPKRGMSIPEEKKGLYNYCDVIMGAMASQIISLTIVYSTVHSGLDQRKHQSSASLAFVRGIHWWPMNFPHKWPVTRKMFPFDDVIKYWDRAQPCFVIREWAISTQIDSVAQKNLLTHWRYCYILLNHLS